MKGLSLEERRIRIFEGCAGCEDSGGGAGDGDENYEMSDAVEPPTILDKTLSKLKKKRFKK